MHFYLAQWILATLQDWNTHDGTSRHKPSTEITHLGLATSEYILFKLVVSTLPAYWRKSIAASRKNKIFLVLDTVTKYLLPTCLSSLNLVHSW